MTQAYAPLLSYGFTPLIKAGDTLTGGFVNSIVSVDSTGKLRASGTYSVVPKPSGFNFTNYGFNIYRNSLGLYMVDFNITSHKPAYTNYYVDPVNGDNSNSGATPLLPKKSIASMITALNGASAASATINLAPGDYDETNMMGATSPQFNISMLCVGVAYNINGITPPSWTKTGGQTYVYEYTKSTGNAPWSAIDRTNLDGFGNPILMTLVADVATCNSTAGSYYLSGTTIYVHPFDNRAADTNVWIMNQTAAGAYVNNTTVKTVYIENVKFWGGPKAFLLNSSDGTNRTSYFNKCHFGYSTVDNAFASNSATGDIMYMVNCQAYYGHDDGFNYHGNGSTCADSVEINCIGYSNGVPTSLGGSNNGSTIHDGGRVIRVGTVAVGNGNRNIADIAASGSYNTQSWNLGCIAGFPNDQTGFLNSSNFHCHPGTSFVYRCEMWLENCRSLGGAISDFCIQDLGVMRVKNTINATQDYVAQYGELGVY